MVTFILYCASCQAVQVYRHGQNPEDFDRFCCQEYHRISQQTYSIEAHKPGIKDQVTVMAFNGVGIRDPARKLRIGINTVIRTLKNSRQSG